jgi:hypothetical protein
MPPLEFPKPHRQPRAAFEPGRVCGNQPGLAIDKAEREF